MALWMTVKQEVFGLAAFLLAFSCAFVHMAVRGNGKRKKRRPAFFVLSGLWWKKVLTQRMVGDVTLAVVTVAFCGAFFGVWRMEMEQRIISKEETRITSLAGETVYLEGMIKKIDRTDYGSRLVVEKCTIIEAGKLGAIAESTINTHIGGMDDETAKKKGKSRSGNERELRNIYAYVDSDDGLKIGMWICVRGELTVTESDRNPGQFDFRSYCLSKGICGSLEGEAVEIVDGRYLAVQEWLRQIGLLLECRLEEIADVEDVGLLKAILLGEKRDVDDDIYRMYQKNGISHVLAISGLHVSVIGMGLWNGLRRLGAGYWSAGAAAFVMLFAFGAIAGFGPSVIRAVFMMGLSFLAGAFGRTYDLPSAMSVPAMGLVLINPYVLTQVSFQLSFLAVAAIFFPGEYLAKVWKLTGFWQNLWTSVSIQLMTWPVVLYHSFEIPIYGLLLNLLVVPLMTYVLVSGILGLAGSFLWRPLGPFLLGGAHYILQMYRMLCELVECMTGAYLVLGRPGFGVIFLYYGGLIAGVWKAASRKRTGEKTEESRRLKWKAGFVRCGNVMLFCLAGLLVLTPMPLKGLEVTFLDVAQGDGIVVRFGEKTMLVDCGSSQKKTIGADCLVPFLKSKGITRLDAVFVTHGDRDHISGIEELLGHPDHGIRINELVVPVSGIGDEACERLVRLAEEQEISVRVIRKGERGLTAYLDDRKKEKALQIECLYPGEDSAWKQTDRNDGSLVLRLQYGNFSMLLTGDVEQDGEERMLRDKALKHVTVLKAAHHGSASSTSQAFLDVVSPDIVIFSYGAGNRYGHPADAVVERCLDIGTKIYKTAESGAVLVRTDGKNMQIAGWLDRKEGI